MKITDVEEITKTRFRVFIDEQFAFVLNKGELSRYRLKKDTEITKDLYDRIRVEAVLRRAKLRALHLLNDMGRTEKQLRQKLLDSEYPEDIVDAAMQYVKSFGYIDDLNYARNFILNRKGKKSKLEIKMLLQKKGVDMDLIETAFEECMDSKDTICAAKELIRKRRVDLKNSDSKEIQKTYAYLMRKGFRYEEIRRAFEEINEEDFC